MNVNLCRTYTWLDNKYGDRNLFQKIKKYKETKTETQLIVHTKFIFISLYNI